MPSKRVLLLAAIGSLSVTAALAIGILLLGDFGDTEGRILATTFGIGVASLLALPGAQLLDQQRGVPLAWATVALAVAAFLMFELALWPEDVGEETWKAFGTVFVFAVATTQIAALTSRMGPRDPASVSRAYEVSVGLVLLLALLATFAIWQEVDDETFYRALAALAVLNVLLVVVQPLLRRLAGPVASAATYGLRIAFEPDGVEEVETSGSDFADAVARSVRRLERGGRRVVRIERVRG